MANKIEQYETNPLNFVTNTSRYANSIIYYYGDQRKITFETYKRQPIQESPNDKVIVISPGLQYRPDLVSQASYGTVDFWWKILEANNIKDIFDFKAGKTIRIPSSVF